MSTSERVRGGAVPLLDEPHVHALTACVTDKLEDANHSPAFPCHRVLEDVFHCKVPLDGVPIVPLRLESMKVRLVDDAPALLSEREQGANEGLKQVSMVRDVGQYDYFPGDAVGGSLEGAEGRPPRVRRRQRLSAYGLDSRDVGRNVCRQMRQHGGEIRAQHARTEGR